MICLLISFHFFCRFSIYGLNLWQIERIAAGVDTQTEQEILNIVNGHETQQAWLPPLLFTPVVFN